MQERPPQSPAPNRNVAENGSKEGFAADILVIDASMLAYKSYFGGDGNALRSENGHPTGIYIGFFNSIHRLKAEFNPRRILVAMEGDNSWRHAFFPAYKTGRAEKPNDFKAQMKHLPRFCEAMGWSVLRAEGYEADDMLASCAVQASRRGLNTIVYTHDKDMFCLMGDNKIRILQTQGRDSFFVDEKTVIEKFGVPPELVSEVLTLAGDTGDKIPGVPCIGPTSAAELILEHKSADAVMALLTARFEESKLKMAQPREPLKRGKSDEDIAAKHEITVQQLRDAWILAGRDKIGVPGIGILGEVKAIKMVREFGTADAAFKNIKDNFELSKKLVKLHTEAVIPDEYFTQPKGPDRAEALRILEKISANAAIQKFHRLYPENGGAPEVDRIPPKEPAKPPVGMPAPPEPSARVLKPDPEPTQMLLF